MISLTARLGSRATPLRPLSPKVHVGLSLDRSFTHHDHVIHTRSTARRVCASMKRALSRSSKPIKASEVFSLQRESPELSRALTSAIQILRRSREPRSCFRETTLKLLNSRAGNHCSQGWYRDNRAASQAFSVLPEGRSRLRKAEADSGRPKQITISRKLTKSAPLHDLGGCVPP